MGRYRHRSSTACSKRRVDRRNGSRNTWASIRMAAIGAPHFTMRNVEIHSRLGQAQVAHPADVIAVDRFDSLPAARASRPRGLVRGERDQTVGACPDLLNRLPYWKDSRKREVRCYTENGHRVLLAERGVGLQTPISCSTREPVSIFLQAICNCIDEEPFFIRALCPIIIGSLGPQRPRPTSKRPPQSRWRNSILG